jgi:hypothetical protein
MTDLSTAETILRDIEFELLQGAIPSGELGRSIQALRQHQSRLRSELLAAGKAPDSRVATRKLIETNDMLLTLLQETVSRLSSLQMELRQISHLLPDNPPPELGRAGGLGVGPSPGPRQQPMTRWTMNEPESCAPGRYPVELENARSPEALSVEANVRPITVPLLGGLLTRVRNALHNLPLFYVRRLAEKQAAINGIYGDWLLALNRQNQQQQARIQALSARLGTLSPDLEQAEGEG